jgi:hypothetical protein
MLHNRVPLEMLSSWGGFRLQTSNVASTYASRYTVFFELVQGGLEDYVSQILTFWVRTRRLFIAGVFVAVACLLC